MIINYNEFYEKNYNNISLWKREKTRREKPRYKIFALWISLKNVTFSVLHNFRLKHFC